MNDKDYKLEIPLGDYLTLKDKLDKVTKELSKFKSDEELIHNKLKTIENCENLKSHFSILSKISFVSFPHGTRDNHKPKSVKIFDYKTNTEITDISIIYEYES